MQQHHQFVALGQVVQRLTSLKNVLSSPLAFSSW
jgi:hypothetical protein